MKKRSYIIIAIAFLGILSFSSFSLISSVNVNTVFYSQFSFEGDTGEGPLNDDNLKTSSSDIGNTLSYAGLEPGDWVLLSNPGGMFDYLIPGEFEHSVMFAGYVQEGEYIWDRDYHEWMTPGTPYVIHSTKSDNAGNGLGYSRWSYAVNEAADKAVALEVDYLTASQKQQTVDWAKSQLDNGIDGYPVGPKYDWGWTSKQLDGDTKNGLSGVYGFYCSELIWAAYKNVHNIDLDPDGDSWSWSTAYGVSPCDLYDDPDSTVIPGADWDPDDSYYVSVWLEGIYYEDDYDPWPSGAGEMYYKYFVGDGWGGSGYETGQYPDEVKRDGPGHILWNRYMEDSEGLNMMFPKSHPLKIRVEAWEADGFLNSDDQYPVFNWWEDNMGNYLFSPDGEDSNGPYQWDVDEDGNWFKWRGWWWWDYWDAGDCRYNIMFTIQNNPITYSACPGYTYNFYA